MAYFKYQDRLSNYNNLRTTKVIAKRRSNQFHKFTIHHIVNRIVDHMNQNPFLSRRDGAAGRASGQQQNSHQQFPASLGLGLDLQRVMAQVKQSQLRRQHQADDAQPQTRETVPAPGRRNSTIGGSNLPMSHLDE